MTALQMEKTGKAPVDPTPWALENLPPFPTVATRLLSVLSKEDVDTREVAQIVSAEPVFATRVLQMANSPLFSIQQQVKAIPHAIVLLGLARVRAITVTRAMGDFVAPAINLKILRTCWQNSLAGAILAEKLARACRMDADFAYVAALVRDIGRLALIMKYPEPFGNLLAVSSEQHYDLTATERELFDVDHCEAGAWLINRMPLPEELGEVVAHHHNAPLAGPFRMVHLVRIADRLADSLGFEVLTPVEPLVYDDVVKEFTEASGAQFGHDPEQLKTEIGEKFQAWA